MEKIDLKDRKILYILAQNSRLPTNRIAKLVGLSKDAVLYRIRRLDKMGMVYKYFTRMNPASFGYTSFQLTLSLSPKKEEMEKIIRHIQMHPFCMNAFTMLGRWDILAEFAVKNDEDVYRIVSDISDACGTALNDLEVKSCAFLYKKTNFMDAVGEVGMQPFSSRRSARVQKGPVKLDAKDAAVLRSLDGNGRKKIVDIVKETGLERDAVGYRKRDLEEAGVIENYGAALNIQALGFQSYYIEFGLKNITPEYEAKLRAYFTTQKGVTYGFHAANSLGGVAFFTARGPSELHERLLEFRNNFLPVMRSLEVMTVLKEHKFDYFPEGVAKAIAEKE
ncbi:MAG: winged helix-turn-helix transcriptional regulator [Candidatus ainarchaeum sp.]|nr:winged helix-turn-helix transcriptional regulator [Candidatus ainarchaeum sp.]